MEDTSIKNTVLIGFYGLSDVGKTTISSALCGTFNQYNLEKKRGLTLKVGYASLTENSSQIYILDNPGHKILACEALRNVDILDYALYVFDSSVDINSTHFKNQIQLYLQLLQIFNAFNISHKILINKCDAASEAHLTNMFKQIRAYSSAEIIPVIATPSGVKHLKDILIRLNCFKKENEYILGRVIKSFNINPTGTVLKKIHGGILGVYTYGNHEFTDSSNYVHNNTFANTWTDLDIAKVVPFNNKICTIELYADPTLFKNDYQKGTLIIDKKHVQKCNLDKTFKLKFKGDIAHNTPGTLLLCGQVIQGQLNKFNKHYLLLESKNYKFKCAGPAILITNNILKIVNVDL